jgi:TATA-box binding protein (TBP) (component of TFIID and TFIIIB)
MGGNNPPAGNEARLLFASGKLGCTGAVNEKMVYDAADKLVHELIKKGLLMKVCLQEGFKLKTLKNTYVDHLI